MASIELQGFSGIAPKVDPRYLKKDQAQTAENCKLTGVSLTSWQDNAQIEVLAINGDVQSIYKLGNYWCQWNADVDVIRSPVAGNTTDKIYYSNLDALRVTDNSLVNAGESTGVITGASQTNPVVIDDVGHTLYTGVRVYIDSIVGMTELNARYFTITVIDDDSYSLDDENGSSHTAYVSGGTWTRTANEYPENSYLAGVPAPLVAPTAALNGTHTTPINTAYVYTFVNDWGEESAPSPVSNIVGADFSTGTVDLTTMDQTYLGHYNNITKWRIYRVATGTTDADYLFVAEVTINGSSPQYNDAIATASLGESIVTEGWVVSPTDLKGIAEMANGISAAFIGNEILFSEPFIPYAWPSKYRLTVPYDIVGIKSFGNTLVVTTTSNPYLVTGITPSSMSLSKVPDRQPCISKRSMIGLNDGVMYACPDGLYFIGASGMRLVTKELYTREEWQENTPSSSLAAQYDNKYVIFFTSSSTGLIFDPFEFGPVSLASYSGALYADPEGDRLYMGVFDATQSLTNIKEFNAGGSRLNYTWKSKRFKLPVRTSLTAARVYGDYSAVTSQAEVDAIAAEIAYLSGLNAALIASGNAGGAVNVTPVNEIAVNGSELYVLPTLPTASTFVLKVYADENLIYNAAVDNNLPVRIGGTGKYTNYEIEISGQYPVQEVKIATSIRDLIRG